MTTNQQAIPEKPYAYACPKRCGCMWRDNLDGTMSLFGAAAKSCDVCERLPLGALVPLFEVPHARNHYDIADHLFIEERGDGIWLVCVEKVHESMQAAQAACRHWQSLYTKQPQDAGPSDWQSIRALIADDAHACTFQTFGQYRTALLKTIDALHA